MDTVNLLTIVVDDSLKNVIEEQIEILGGKGYTTSVVEGKGRSGIRNSVWTGENVKIETIVDDFVLMSIMRKLEDVYFEKYAIVAYYQKVHVVRTNRFSGDTSKP